MDCFIKKRSDFKNSHRLTVLDCDYVLDSVYDDASTFSVLTEITGIEGDFLYFDGWLGVVDKCAPEKGQTTITCKNILNAFSRSLVSATGTYIEAFIKDTLEAEYKNLTDALYDMPYLTVTTTSSTAFISPDLDDNNLWNLKSYIAKVRRLKSVFCTFGISGNTLTVEIGVKSIPTRKVDFNDRSNRLESESYSKSSVAKVTAITDTTTTHYYLHSDGTYNTTDSDRVNGEWVILPTTAEKEAEAVAETFAKSAYSHLITFHSDRDLSFYDSLQIRRKTPQIIASNDAQLVEKTGVDLAWLRTVTGEVKSLTVNGKSTQTVTVQGKNLFDWETSKVVDTNGAVRTTFGSISNGVYTNQMSLYSTYCCVTVPSGTIIAGLTYTISFDVLSPETQSIYFGVHNTSGAYTKINQEVEGNVLTHVHLSVVAPAGYTYHQHVLLQGSSSVSYTNLNVTFSNIQIELSSTATAYEPFVPNSPSPEYQSPILSAGGALTSRNADSSQNSSITMPTLRSLPSGTKDTLVYLGGSLWRHTQNVGFIASYNGETVPSGYMSTTGELTTGAEVQYALATPVVTNLTLGELKTYPNQTRITSDTEVIACVKVGGEVVWDNSTTSNPTILNSYITSVRKSRKGTLYKSGELRVTLTEELKEMI
jgi:hypothetical protein